MSDDQQKEETKIQWLNQFLSLIKFGQENDFLEDGGSFGFCGSFGAEKISFNFKIEPTNIIQFSKIEKK